MKDSGDGKTTKHPSSLFRSPWPWLLAIAFAIIIGLLFGPRSAERFAPKRSEVQMNPDTPVSPLGERPSPATPLRSRPGKPPSPETIVAGQLARFAQSRRRLAYALAQQHGVDVPGEVESFFEAVESGDWERIEAAFQRINGGDSSAGQWRERPPGIAALWPAIIDAYGAAEQVHDWPAQKLLDYGNTILSALGPDMVYVGGTDNGRWIPELLNDTGAGEGHVIVTQNGLADLTYLDYVRLQYDGRLAPLTEEDSQRAFGDYLADAQGRLEHDQQFPDEPKQVRPREDIQVIDGKVQVSGQVAVMSINEKLLQMLMDKNPNLTFALQESYPLKGTYSDALPLGPLMELHAQDEQTTFTSERAAQTSEYWRLIGQQLLADPEMAGSPAALKSWSHDINSAANLMAAHQHYAQAEETYRLSSQLWPGNPEPVLARAGLLNAQGQPDAARGLLLEFDRQHPDQRADLRASTPWTALIRD